MNPLKGIALKLMATLVFTAMGALVKVVGDTIPTGQIVFCRSFFAFPTIIVFFAAYRELGSAFRITRPWLHAFRTTVGCTGMFLGFAALLHIPLTDQIAIGYAMPIFAVIIAAVVLKEVVRVYRWTAVLVGLVGVVVILSPHLPGMLARQGDGASLGALFALGAAMTAAVATICVRLLTKTEPTASIVMTFTAGSTVFGLATLPFGWVMPTAGEAAILVLIGLMGGLGQIFHTMSYRYGEASVIAPFEYASLLWATALGFVLFRDVPTPNVVVGAAIVVAAGLFVIWRERQLGLERRPEKEAGRQGP